VTRPRIKGSAVRELLRFYSLRSSPDALREAWRSLRGPTRALFDPEQEALGVLPNEWYDSQAAGELVDAILKTWPPGTREESMREAARFGTRSLSRGIYKVLLEKLTSPQMYARLVPRFWTVLHDTGSREVVITSATTARSITRDWGGHHPALCTGTLHTMAAFFELMGFDDVSVKRVECVADGGLECVAEVSWTSR
jgi:hypothetical protein